jgi:hypothetical protein
MECQAIDCKNQATKIHAEEFEMECKDEHGRRYLDNICRTETNVCDNHAALIDKSTDSTYGNIIKN